MSDKASTALKLGHLFGDKQHPGRNQMANGFKGTYLERGEGDARGGGAQPGKQCSIACAEHMPCNIALLVVVPLRVLLALLACLPG